MVKHCLLYLFNGFRNEEILAINELPDDSLSAKVVKYQCRYSLIEGFTEACKKVVLMICNGLLSPLSPDDTEANFVYLYDNIFFNPTADCGNTVQV
jgi:hypothetical protein